MRPTPAPITPGWCCSEPACLPSAPTRSGGGAFVLHTSRDLLQRSGAGGLLEKRVQLSSQDKDKADQVQPEREDQKHAEQRVRLIRREQRQVQREHLRD